MSRVTLIDSVTSRQEIDTSSGRVFFDKVFDTTKDIYISFRVPTIDVNMLSETAERILTENSINIALDFKDMTALRTGFVVFAVDGDMVLDETNGENGPGLGMLSYDPTKNNLSGHFASVAFDVFGGYSLSGIYHNIVTGYEELTPKTVSARISSVDSEYQFLSSSTPTDNKAFDLNVENKILRFKFKNHLTSLALDYKNDIQDDYINIFKAETNANPGAKPKGVRIGIASSGVIKLPIQDITYSGTLSS